jgi:hypothetical protein
MFGIFVPRGSMLMWLKFVANFQNGIMRFPRDFCRVALFSITLYTKKSSVVDAENICCYGSTERPIRITAPAPAPDSFI